MEMQDNRMRDLARGLGDVLSDFARRAYDMSEPPSAPSTVAAATDSTTTPSSDMREQARLLQRERRSRVRHLPADLFHDPAWDVLLALYVDGEMAVKEATSHCLYPITTAQRWITVLREHGLVRSHDDPLDRRRTLLDLTDAGRCAMEAHLAHSMSTH